MGVQDIQDMNTRWGRDSGGAGFLDERLDGERYSDSSKTAEWMVRIESGAGGGILTNSNNASFLEYCRSMKAPLFSITRRTNANVVDSNKYDSSRVRISNIIMVLPHDIWTPQLENITISGIKVDSVQFVRLTNSGMLDEVVERVNFFDNIIQEIKQDRDTVMVEFRTEKYSRTTIRRTQTGEQAGQNSVTYDVKQSQIQAGA